MATLLLEIGTEEIPSRYLPGALTQLDSLARAQLKEARLAFTDLYAWGTPRRIILYVEGVSEHQAPMNREVRGPAVADAFASNGEPTQAALGFARSQKVSIPELRLKKVENGEFVFAIFYDEGQPAFSLLPALLHHLIGQLSFPKMMHWGSGAFRFARPIRWLVAMLDERVVPLTIDDVTAGRCSRGHRFLSPDAVTIASAEHYPRMMEESLVIIDPARRRDIILQQLQAIAADFHATILYDQALLDDTVFSVEYVTAVRAAIDESLLSLPEEVLLHVLQQEQRFFPLADERGELLPAFIAVRNGDRAFLTSVREGYESVARAKLLDALFFYEQDMQATLEERVESLRGIIFQESLGSMYEKARRMETLAGLFAAWLHFSPEDRKMTERAALLARADLSSALVNEHPMLSGTMGMIYAHLSGENEAIAQAIGEQYLPRSSYDPIPLSRLGQLLALADKVDTLTACFTIGLAPNGAEDPYALSQQAIGILRILVEAQLPLSLPQITQHALRGIDGVPEKARSEVEAALADFYKDTFTELLASASMSKRVQHAVVARHADRPAGAWRLAHYLRDHLQDPALLHLARVAQRLEKVLNTPSGAMGEPNNVADETEHELRERVRHGLSAASEAAQAGRYDAVQEILTGFAPSVEQSLKQSPSPDLVADMRKLYQLLGDLPALLNGDK